MQKIELTDRLVKNIHLHSGGGGSCFDFTSRLKYHISFTDKIF